MDRTPVSAGSKTKLGERPPERPEKIPLMILHEQVEASGTPQSTARLAAVAASAVQCRGRSGARGTPASRLSAARDVDPSPTLLAISDDVNCWSVRAVIETDMVCLMLWIFPNLRYAELVAKGEGPMACSKAVSRKANPLTMLGSAIALVVVVFAGRVRADCGNGCDPTPTCDNGEVCMWRDAGFSFNDCFLAVTPPSSDGNMDDGTPNWCTPHTGQCDTNSMNDNISSVMNRSSKWAIFYEDSGSPGNGPRLCLGPGTQVFDLTNMDTSFNDRISAYDTEDARPARCDKACVRGGPSTTGCSNTQ